MDLKQQQQPQPIDVLCTRNLEVSFRFGFLWSSVLHVEAPCGPRSQLAPLASHEKSARLGAL